MLENAVAAHAAHEASPLVGPLPERLGESARPRMREPRSSHGELESLCYSVCHDLRAPLRHLQGYISLLLERPGVAQDSEARVYANRAAAAVSQLARLTDDMLQFSRKDWISVSCTHVRMSELVEQTRREFQCDIGLRDVIWRIDSLPDAVGDESMLRRVWQNLIENALKYTRTRPSAHIEIGAADSVDEWIYYVKDNGVGFDPIRAEQLFTMFERLHDLREFDGYGIGLANVCRLVHCHGGRVWAHGEVERGASFFFSLPKS
jgi:light-regulated signal transduction histidine kinase (bacteriophytochrome)